MTSYARLSLYYLFGYLTLTGLALLFAPDISLRLLLATRTYDDTFVRFTGAFMIALGVVVLQFIRYQVAVLYPTTVGVRVFFLACITWFYQRTHDPLFLVVFGVVALGFVLTTTGLILDRRRR
jgi:uncharacterized protein YjeT (DUF2065 family)